MSLCFSGSLRFAPCLPFLFYALLPPLAFKLSLFACFSILFLSLCISHFHFYFVLKIWKKCIGKKRHKFCCFDRFRCSIRKEFRCFFSSFIILSFFRKNSLIFIYLWYFSLKHLQVPFQQAPFLFSLVTFILGHFRNFLVRYHKASILLNKIRPKKFALIYDF